MMGLLASVAWYCALLLACLAAAAAVRPLARLRLGTRARALRVLLASVTVVAALALIAPSAHTVDGAASHLDESAPAFHYNEFHQRHIAATPDRVFAAIMAVTSSEIRFFGLLTTIRRFGQPGPESILNAPEHQPLIDVATRSGFVLLANDPPHEVVFGAITLAPRAARGIRPLTPALYQSINGPGFVKATMNFRVTAEAGGCLVTTETRVYGTSADAIRRFTPYWRTILPGSWILRVTWLEAIARRAEAAEQAAHPPSSGTM